MPPPLPDASVEAGRGCKTKHTDRVCGSRTLHVTAPSQHFLPPEGASGAGVGAVAAGAEDEVSGPGSVDADVGAEQEQAEGMTAPVAVHQPAPMVAAECSLGPAAGPRSSASPTATETWSSSSGGPEPTKSTRRSTTLTQCVGTAADPTSGLPPNRG